MVPEAEFVVHFVLDVVVVSLPELDGGCEIAEDEIEPKVVVEITPVLDEAVDVPVLVVDLVLGLDWVRLVDVEGVVVVAAASYCRGLSIAQAFSSCSSVGLTQSGAYARGNISSMSSSV